MSTFFSGSNKFILAPNRPHVGNSRLSIVAKDSGKPAAQEGETPRRSIVTKATEKPADLVPYHSELGDWQKIPLDRTYDYALSLVPKGYTNREAGSISKAGVNISLLFWIYGTPLVSCNTLLLPCCHC